MIWYTRAQMKLSDPPRALRKARLDNIALVPASLLSQKATYMEIANRLPQGSVLLCETNTKLPEQLKKILSSVASYFRSHGCQVITLPLEQSQRKVKLPVGETMKLAF